MHHHSLSMIMSGIDVVEDSANKGELRLLSSQLPGLDRVFQQLVLLEKVDDDLQFPLLRWEVRAFSNGWVSLQKQTDVTGVNRDHLCFSFCNSYCWRGSGWTSRESISPSVLAPCTVDYSHGYHTTAEHLSPPSGVLSRRVRRLENGLDCRVISQDLDNMAIEMRPEVGDCPHDCERLQLGDAVVPFTLVQCSAGIGNRV